MILQPVLVNASWREASSPAGSFQAVNPSTGTPLKDIYPISSFAEVEEALEAALIAASVLIKTRPEAIADFLENFAGSIEGHADELVEIAHLETALPKEPRLKSTELPRTTNQLCQAARAVTDRSWCRATIDTKANIRSKYSPLGGPVVVLGPNNFPFAFNSAAGGDFAAAIAAGNPVLAKANPGHPGTTKMFAELAFESVKKAGLPKGIFQMIYHLRPEDGLKLVGHALVSATSFTGSRPAGLRLKEAAEKSGKLIYLEMSSVNPVFILPGALKERAASLASDLFNSCTLGTGQFCTKPGLIVLVRDEHAEEFLRIARKLFEPPPTGSLLGQNVLDGIESAVKMMKDAGAQIVTGGEKLEGPGFRYANTLLGVAGENFLKNPKSFQQEAFGTVALAVFAKHFNEMLDIAAALEGNLAASIYSHGADLEESLYARLEPILRRKVGRLLNDKMPTGVAVSPAMVHGGPFPASGHPGFTAVGIPASLLRFAALQSYDNVRPNRLPAELRDKNPTGRMWRLIDGDWTQRDA
jgi:alpha-ketoglutaric semialdehyde dehydrogenase